MKKQAKNLGVDFKLTAVKSVDLTGEEKASKLLEISILHKQLLSLQAVVLELQVL